MLKLSLEAEKDILDAYNWYEDKTEGLGLKFIECIDKKMININNNPFIYQKIYEEIRIAVIKEFPYSIFYLK